ncbi:MAG: CHASE2 domain-containing protein, partial [Chloroflexaceae bacterium]|nr:CHASE2 domain-containing protein [Chloroflexaceae bacterium]
MGAIRPARTFADYSRSLLRDNQRAGRLLSLYERIWSAAEAVPLSPCSPIAFNDSQEQLELLLSGLVTNQQGRLTVKNPIYRAVFDREWIMCCLSDLRPYGASFDAWIASNKQAESTLLRGQSLTHALAWGLGKSLSNLDYQYLAASQELAKRQVQAALADAERASEILAIARKQARQSLAEQRLPRSWLPGIVLTVTLPILLLRLGGVWQGLEWHWLDRFFRWRSLPASVQRVTVIEIDEATLGAVGQWPVPDGVVAAAVRKIQAAAPKVIGLDLYRDLPVEPGRDALMGVFKTTPNLVGIEKLVGETVAAPPLLDPIEQIGFADLVVDADGKVRRGLLSLADGEQVRYSLALQLALRYLQAQSIQPQTAPNDFIRLGKAILPLFRGNDGGYVRAD